MEKQKIKIRGARQHNLKNIDLDIPKNKLVIFTGVSGSGKSSLAFDTIYAEGQRRYVESLSAYARQFLGVMDKPDLDTIEGLSPAISISQKTVSHNPRSTVGTVTEIYDYLRLLFARIGKPHCPNCGLKVDKQDLSQIISSIKKVISKEQQSLGKRPGRWLILSPVVRGRKGEFTQLFNDLQSKGYTKIRVDNHFYNLDEDFVLIKTNRHSIDVVIDRITSKSDDEDLSNRLTEAVEQALQLSDGLVILAQVKDSSFNFPEKPKTLQDYLYSEKFACPVCNINLEEIEPRLFSFNTPYGACRECNGLGKILRIDPSLVINEKLTIKEGALHPLTHHFTQNTWLARTILSVCQDYHIPTNLPLSEITDEQKKILLYGTGNKVYRVEGENRYGRATTITESFNGIIAYLTNRYQETGSDYMRNQIEKYMRQEICPVCSGSRLKLESLSITIAEKNIAQVTQLSINKFFDWLQKLNLSKQEEFIGKPIIKEISNRLGFLLSVGLEYLTLDREAKSLAGGEAQRIMLASQIGSGLTGVLYVLDEPSIGLHQRDNQRLIKTLKTLRDLGNTVIVVEHDKETMENADYLFDFGPGGGKHGGQIVAAGNLEEIKQNKNSLTGDYLSGRKRIATGNWSTSLEPRRSGRLETLEIDGCSQFNLKNINVKLPLGKLICITGVSGSGKSTLIVETLYKALKMQFNPYYKETPGSFKKLNGYQYIKNIQLIDQSPIGRTPRSNPATYTKAFDYIRDLFTRTKMAQMRGYQKGRFSFNVKGGRCEACEGQGENRIEMQFMPDVYVKCDVCKGYRYNTQTLEVTYKEKNIAEVLSMTVEEALEFFKNITGLKHKLETLLEVGLSYIELGQPAPILSGGEAQRVKLATELSKHGQGRTLYILDEPTTGLHFHDLQKLLKVLRELVNKGNTVVIIEHNLDIIKNADWIIDLGPEGGENGGEIIATGTPKQIARIRHSYTGQFLHDIL